MQETVDAVAADDSLDTGERFIDQPTIPFLRPDRPVTNSGASATRCVERDRARR